MFYLFYKFCKGINIVKTEYYIIYGSVIGAKGSRIKAKGNIIRAKGIKIWGCSYWVSLIPAYC